jgi:hypothetical protein
MSRSDLKAHADFAARHGYDPFKALAPEILEQMMAVVADRRAINPALKIDACGAQAADVATAESLFRICVDNISVAPTLRNLAALGEGAGAEAAVVRQMTKVSWYRQRSRFRSPYTQDSSARPLE